MALIGIMVANAPSAQSLPAVSSSISPSRFREQCFDETGAQKASRISVCRQRVTTSLAQ